MKKYTRKIHIKRLRGMLKRKEPCLCCPVGRRYSPFWDGMNMWASLNVACGICRVFIGLIGDDWILGNARSRCPCLVLGEEEALKRTIIALDKEVSE